MAVSSQPILVTGATGQQGGAVARALLGKGQRVRVMTRHPEKATSLAKAGAEIVQGDLTDHASLQTVLRGVHGVFAMSTPFEAGMEAEVRQGIMLADAAKQADTSPIMSMRPLEVRTAIRGFRILRASGKWNSTSVRSDCRRPFCGPCFSWRISPLLRDRQQTGC